MAIEPFALHEAVLDAQARMGRGILIVDVPTGKISYANEAIVELTGYPVREILELPSFMARHDGVDYMQGYHVGRPRAIRPASSGAL